MQFWPVYASACVMTLTSSCAWATIVTIFVDGCIQI